LSELFDERVASVLSIRQVVDHAPLQHTMTKTTTTMMVMMMMMMMTAMRARRDDARATIRAPATHRGTADSMFQ
jgi:hypothetical protein